MAQFNELKEKNKTDQKKLSEEKKFAERHLDEEISNYDKMMEEQEAKRTETLVLFFHNELLFANKEWDD